MISMQTRIALLMNWKNRDLRPCVQLSVILDKRGYQTRIIPHGPRTTPLAQLRRFRPHFIVFPQVQGETKLVQYARKIGSRIIVLHTEGTWTPETAAGFYERGLRLYGDENPVELDLVWGEVMKNLLAENTNLDKSIIKVVGCPRFDVYKPPLSGLMMPRSEFSDRYGLSRKNPIIVWATNFVNLERTKRDLEYQKEFADRDMDEENAIQRSLRSKHLSAIMRLVREYPECDFAIKLHPLEVPEYYETQLEQEKLEHRVAIINDITIEHVLNSASLFLNTNSTSSTEAWFLGIPTVSLLFDERARSKLSAFAAGNELVFDYDQLKATVDRVLAENYTPSTTLLNARAEFIDKWFFKIDGKSTLRAAAEIDTHIQNHFSDKAINPVYSREVFIERFSSTIIYKTARKLYHKSHGTTSYWDKIREYDKLQEHEVEDLYQAVAKLYEGTEP